MILATNGDYVHKQIILNIYVIYVNVTVRTVFRCLVNRANLVYNFSQYVYLFSVHVSGPSSGEIAIFLGHLVLVTVCG